jgi:hypothetical protein
MGVEWKSDGEEREGGIREAQVVGLTGLARGARDLDMGRREKALVSLPHQRNIPLLKSQLPVPQNVTLFGKRMTLKMQ